jgi:hypothetical protein
MVGGVLCEVVEEVIGVSHDGRRDPRWYEKLDDTSEDDAREGSKSHGTVMNVVKAQDFRAQQDIQTIVPKWGLVGNRLEGVPEHVGYC